MSTVTPLQLAQAYATLANDGKICQPHVVDQIVDDAGETVKKVSGHCGEQTVPYTQEQLDYIMDCADPGARAAAPRSRRSPGSRLSEYPIAGKTGTAFRGYPFQDTSWFAGVVPANDPQYVVVAMVEQAGFGSDVAAPIVRKVIEGIYGIESGAPAVVDGGAGLMADLVAGRVFAQERRPIRHVDLTLLVVTAALVVIGLFAIYSATSQTLRQDGLDPLSRVNKQVATAVLGFIVLLVMMTFDYRFLKVYAGFIYGITLFLLLVLQIPGVAGGEGATSNYIDIPGVSLLQISPSEFAKVGLIVILSAMLSELRTPVPMLSDVVRVLMVAGLTMGLVFINVEIGTTIVLMAITVGILVVAGTRAKHLIALAAGAIILIVLAFQLGAIKDYQVARLTAFFDSGNAAEDARYNLEQSEIAVGSGGMFGRGYLHGTQTNLDYVPEQHTDFIFTVIGEEFGFFGSVFVLGLFAALLWRAIRIAYLSKDSFGTYLATGVASMFAIQMFVNVGMVIGIMPITGIPLPFLSYGGTAMLVNFVAVGILLNVHMRRFK